MPDLATATPSAPAATSPLISAAALRQQLDQGRAPAQGESQNPPRWLLVDCRFDLARPDAGQAAYLAGHLPGAFYLHLDKDLSGPKRPGSGRHPLPERAMLAARLAALGADADTPVLAYDASAGVYASRLWWLLRWLGHDRVWVLDGGLPAWQAAGGELSSGLPAAPAPGRFEPRPSLVASVGYGELRGLLTPAASPEQPQAQVVDARSPERFRGENETLDPVGGRIPGALNRFYADNLVNGGVFKPADQLRGEWLALMAGRPASQLVQQCGSGVTACHNLVAMAHAGLDGARLYPGSWSEWCAQPDAPIARG